MTHLPATIDLNADGTAFIITFPAAPGVRAHSVRVPIQFTTTHHCKHESERAFGVRETCQIDGHSYSVENKTVRALYKAIADRNQAIKAQVEEIKINEKGAPTQALIDAFFAQGGQVEDDAVRAEQKFREKFGDELFSELEELAKEVKI